MNKSTTKLWLPIAAIMTIGGTYCYLSSESSGESENLPGSGAGQSHSVGSSGNESGQLRRSGRTGIQPVAPHQKDNATCSCPSCGIGENPIEVTSARRAPSKPVQISPHWNQRRKGEQVVLSLPRKEQLAGDVVSFVEHQDGTAVQIVRLEGKRPGKLIIQENKAQAFFLGQVYFDEGNTGLELVRDDNGQLRAKELRLDEMLCARFENNKLVSGLPEAAAAAEPAEEQQAQAEAAAAVPSLNSLPTASAVVYLDFDGQTVTGTSWNDEDNLTIDALGVDYSASKITRIWERVAADMEPFNINVTTDESVYLAAPSRRRIRCVITPTYEWFGSAGGVAYLGSFRWSGDTPCWVFASRLGNSEKSVAEAASHEVGHTFGLGHDGKDSTEYYRGHGSGTTGWAPIMGVGYSRSLVQWSKGEYTGATNTQNDLSMITASNNGFGYRSDDHGNSQGNASEITVVNATQVEADGILERTDDVDVFRFQSLAGPVSLTVSPVSNYSNIDAQLELYDGTGNLLASANSENSQGATLSTEVAEGQYFLHIKTAGERTVDTGYSNYASLGAYRIAGQVVSSTRPVVEIFSPSANSIRLPADVGLVLEASVTDSGPVTSSWIVVSSPAGGLVTFGDSSTATTTAQFSKQGSYVIRLSGDDGSEVASKEITIHVDTSGTGNVGAQVQLGPRFKTGSYADLTATVSDNDGPSATELEWVQHSGPGNAFFANAAALATRVTMAVDGVYILRLIADDGAIKTFADQEVERRTQQHAWITATSPLKASVADNGNDHALWREINYDDQAWLSGTRGVGYERSSGYESEFNIDVSAMYNWNRSCRIRAPFYVVQPSLVENISLRVKYDDAFVAYLNGHEITRRGNIASGQPAWSDGAISGHSDSQARQWVVIDVSQHQNLLIEGNNVLAVHGLNYLTTSSDFLFRVELTGQVKETDYLQALQMANVDVTSAAGSLEADPDGDGYNNLLEHALGMDPSKSEQRIRPIQLQPSTGEDTGQLVLSLPEGTPADVEYELEASPSLGSDQWTVIATRKVNGNWTSTGNAVVSSMGVVDGREKISVGTPSNVGSMFYRLKVALVTE